MVFSIQDWTLKKLKTHLIVYKSWKHHVVAEFSFVTMLNIFYRFDCGKCKFRNNKTVDVKGHLRYIHSDMFRLPSATIFIEIQNTTDYNRTGKDNIDFKLQIIFHNYYPGYLLSHFTSGPTKNWLLTKLFSSHF